MLVFTLLYSLMYSLLYSLRTEYNVLIHVFGGGGVVFDT